MTNSGSALSLGDRLAQIESTIDGLKREFLLLLREFDESRQWAQDGALSCSGWLSWRLGLSPAAARERVRIAHALTDLPAIDAAFAAGELSYSKVRAITRVAEPESEDLLLNTARAATAGQLDKLCSMMRKGQRGDCDEPGSEPEPQRSFRSDAAANGMVRLTFQLTADEAALVTRALDASAEAPNQRAEALVAIAEELVRGDAPDRSPTEVVVHVAADSIGDAAGSTAEGAVLGREACRRLMCDAGLVPVLEDADQKPLDVGRKTRSIPATIRRAMALRDEGCRFPGCTNVIVDGHHIQHWADGGSTSLANLVSLCRTHHRLVHERRARVLIDADGAVAFFAADSRPLPQVPPRPSPRPVEVEHIDPWRAVATDNSGDRISYPYVVDVLTHEMNWRRGAGTKSWIQLPTTPKDKQSR